jgi:ParB family transcriptional regulator, chromosome partitioning protein
MELSGKSRLGKGLEALISTSSDKREYIIELEPSKIIQNPTQPRKKFEEDKIRELANSIIEKGIIQPIIVREKDGKYEIVAGERRYRAAIEAKMKKIPAIVKNVDDEESLELAIIENVQRENLNPIEEGEAYKLLIEKYSYTQEELAKKLGKNRSTITNKIRALKLPEDVKKMIADGKLSSGHAIAIMAIEDEVEQIKFAQKVENEKITVREAEQISKEIKEKSGRKSKKVIDKKKIEIIEMENRLRDFLGTKVKIKESKENRGKIEIEFYSEGDLERIFETIGIN